MSQPSYSYPKVSRILFFLLGGLFFVFGLMHHQFLFLFLFNESNEPVQIHPLQWVYVGISLVCFSAAYLAPRWNPFQRIFSRPPIVNGLFALFTTVMPLMLLELVLQQVVYLYYPTPVQSIFIPDETRGWRMRPNSSGICGSIRVQVNGHGLRGLDIPEQKAPEEKRLLVLGDSVTFGHNLEQETDTYPAIMDAQLNNCGDPYVRIINGGVNGYSTWHEYQFLQQEGFHYLPDAVLLGFVLNDVHETYRIDKHGLYEHNPLPMLNHSSLLFFAQRLILRLRLGPNLQETAADQEQNEMSLLIQNPASPNVLHLWAVTVDWIGKIHQLCRNRQIPLIVALFPTSDQLKSELDLTTPQSVLHEKLKQYSVPSIDLLPVFHQYQKANNADIFDIMLDQTHFTPLGSKIAANALVDFCRQELPF